jgi:hypothetical protein
MFFQMGAFVNKSPTIGVFVKEWELILWKMKDRKDC